MFKFLKYLPLIGKFDDISVAYKEETGKDRPAYLSRRFVGAIVALTGATLAVIFGVTLDANMIEEVTKNIETMVSAGITLYGIVLAVYGLLKKKKEVK